MGFWGSKAEAPFTVHELSDLKLPWSVRRRVRRLKRRGRTGFLLGAILASGGGGRGPRRPPQDVTVQGDNHRLSLSNQDSRRTVWTQLPAGGHQLTFRSTRPGSASVFDYGVELADGDIFVAVCQPIQPWTLFGANPDSDDWYIGVV